MSTFFRTCGSSDIGEILNRLWLRVLDALHKLLDLALRRVELLAAEAVQLLASFPELDRVVERDVAALEPLDDLSELFLRVFEGHSSPTVAEKLPSATRTSISSPGATAVAARTTAPSCRTIA